MKNAETLTPEMESLKAKFTLLTRRFITGPVFGLAVLLATLSPARPAKAGWLSLTGILPDNIAIRNWLISPDSRYVVYYTVKIQLSGRQNLYSAPITGGSPVKLTPPHLPGGDLGQFVITPDSQYVIYTAEQEVADRRDLYRVPITGGMAVKLNTGVAQGIIGVGDFKIDPDNARVVYSLDSFGHVAEFDLYSVPIIGGISQKLNYGPEDGKKVGVFDIDSVRDCVVYVAVRDTQGHMGLFSAPIAGGTVAKISMPNLNVANKFEIYRSPTYPVVVFTAISNGSTSADLYRNPTDGSGVLTKLNYPLASNETVIGYHVSSNGARVIYNVAVSTPTTIPYPTYGNLYSVPFVSGESLPISPAAVPGFGVYQEFVITADSERVVYKYQQSQMVKPVLESIALNGSDRKFLYTGGSGEALLTWQVSPNDQRVVYITSPAFSAYSISTIGGTQVPLGLANFLLITPDSSRVVYPTNQLSDTSDLYSQQIGGGDARNLSLLPNGANTFTASISPDGRWIVFGVDYKPGYTAELRVSDGAEAQLPIPTPAPPPTSNIYPVYLPIIVR